MMSYSGNDGFALALAGPAILLGLALCVSAPALACGQFFGVHLLQDRERNLMKLWEGDFRSEAKRLVALPEGHEGFRLGATPPALIAIDEHDAFHLSERARLEINLLGYHNWKALEDQIEAAITHALNTRVAKREETLIPVTRDLDPSHAAYVIGRAYSVQFSSGFGMLDQRSLPYFQTAAGHRATDQRPWPILGLFMLGRVQVHYGDYSDAADTFDELRGRVIAGEPDPLGLAAASYSEEARGWWRAGEHVRALHGYATHAALGDQGAASSLLFMTRRASRDRAIVAQLIEDDLGRDLLALLAYTHFYPAPYPARTTNRVRPRNSDNRNSPDEAQDDQPLITQQELLAMLVDSLDRRPAAADEAGRMAAMAWYLGDFELAERFEAHATGALGAWVRAKLALRAGDLERAAQSFSEAAEGFPRNESWGRRGYGRSTHDPMGEPYCRVRAEHGIVALAQGEMTEALKLFLMAGAVYWIDAAYVAERVLDTDSLIKLVDSLDLSAMGPRIENPEHYIHSDSPWMRLRAFDVGEALQHLLARRLMREQRFADALYYFEDDVLRQRAIEYIELQRQVQEQQGTERAVTQYRLAHMTRYYGLRLLAYESEPDYMATQGRYRHHGAGARLVFGPLRDGDLTLITPVERERLLAQADSLVPRFHYRRTAAELAASAAELLPQDSPDVPILLCQAYWWSVDTDAPRARDYLARHRAATRTAEGHAPMPSRCPEPSF